MNFCNSGLVITSKYQLSHTLFLRLFTCHLLTPHNTTMLFGCHLSDHFVLQMVEWRHREINSQPVSNQVRSQTACILSQCATDFTQSQMVFRFICKTPIQTFLFAGSRCNAGAVFCRWSLIYISTQHSISNYNMRSTSFARPFTILRLYSWFLSLVFSGIKLLKQV